MQSERDGKAGIFLQPVDGIGAARHITTSAATESHIPESISRKGWLLYSVLKDTAYSLWAVRLDGTENKAIKDVQSADPLGAVFSPDGHWFAYAYNEQGGGVPSPNRGTYVQPFPPTGLKLQVTKTANDYHPTWGLDGRSVFYIPGAAPAVTGVPFLANASFGRPSPVQALTQTGFVSIDHRNYDVLPNGKFLLLKNPDARAIVGQNAMMVVLDWFSELQRLVPAK